MTDIFFVVSLSDAAHEETAFPGYIVCQLQPHNERCDAGQWPSPRS